jgi:hypothetical protein
MVDLLAWKNVEGEANCVFLVMLWLFIKLQFILLFCLPSAQRGWKRLRLAQEWPMLM